MLHQRFALRRDTASERLERELRRDDAASAALVDHATATNGTDPLLHGWNMEDLTPTLPTLGTRQSATSGSRRRVRPK